LESVATLREEAQEHAAAALASLCHLKLACQQLDTRVPQAIAVVNEFGHQCAPLCLVLLRILSLGSSRDRAVEHGLLPICARILREASSADVLSLCAQITFRATIPSAHKTLALRAGVLQVRVFILVTTVWFVLWLTFLGVGAVYLRLFLPQSLVPLLSHPNEDVARSAAEALSIMSVDIEVKKEALLQNCSDPLQQLLLRSPSVQLAACQVEILSMHLRVVGHCALKWMQMLYSRCSL
jgi:hypothetical protein